ncbi:MAG: tetratricopeptide repeat protein [Ktedonobacteraceae bacterium]
MAHYHKGLSLTMLMRFEEALASLEQALQLDPTLAIAYSNKGVFIYLICINLEVTVIICYTYLYMF